MTTLTIGIPVFNAMPYLRESMESILRQTYSEFVIVAVNDGSTDGSLEYLQSIRDPRLQIWNQPNRGLTATLNRMLDEAKTPWLMRFDADDVAYPHRVAKTMEHIGGHPNAGMFYSLADYYPAPSVGQFRSTKGSPAQITDLVRSGYLPSICHPTVTLNVARAQAAGGYRFNYHVEDIDLWWRMALRHDIRMIPEVTLGFRQNCKSVSSENLERQLLNTLYIQYLLLSHLWNLEPLPYGDVRPSLSGLFSQRRLSFKRYLRAFNMELGRGHKPEALWQATRALFASPGNFASRLADEFVPGRTIALGENPSVFKKNAERMWPGQAVRRSVSARPAAPATERERAAKNAATATIPSFPISQMASTLKRVRVGRADVHATTFDQALTLVVEHAATSTLPAYVVTPNAQHVVLLESDLRFREAYENASLVLADGASMVFGALVLGDRLKGRVPGVDFFQRLCGEAAKRGLRVFFLGGKAGAAQCAAEVLQRAYPGLIVAGTCCPQLGFERDASQIQEVSAKIREGKPHILFVGLGAPKQENWIYEHGRTLGIPVCIGIGGSFEMVAGYVPRAPQYIRAVGMEWLFRMAVEPRRLWRRYLVGNAQFLVIVLRQLWDLHSSETDEEQGLEKGL